MMLPQKFGWFNCVNEFGTLPDTLAKKEGIVVMLMMLMYHRILPYEHPQAISISQFNAQLDYLEKHYSFLTPEEVVSYIRGELKDSSRPYAALSFDDGWCDNHLFATDILKERRLRAVCAVSAGYLYDGCVRREETADVLNRSMDDAQKAAAAGDFRSYASIQELKEMAASGVWRLEAHGTCHIKGDSNCSILSVPQKDETLDAYRSRLKNDIQSCRIQLKEKLGVETEMFFWPWGHWSTAGVETVKELGLLQFTVSKGAIRRGSSAELLPRVGVSPKWKKFRKNCFVFRHPVLAGLHDLFHTEKVCFDNIVESMQ